MRANVRSAMRHFVEATHEGSRSRAAVALGTSQPTISDIVNDKKGVGLAVMVKLARATGRSLEELLGVRDESGDIALDEVIARSARPTWVHDAARSRRALDGATLTEEQWEAWMDAVALTDTVVSSGMSKQERDFERKRARKPRG